MISFDKVIHQCNPTLYQNIKLTHPAREFPCVTSINLIVPLHTRPLAARSNQCSVLCHHRRTLPVLKLHMNVCNLLCLASFTEHNFVWDPSMFSLVSLVYFYCWVVRKCRNMQFVYLFSCWWNMGCFQFGAVMNNDVMHTLEKSF